MCRKCPEIYSARNTIHWCLGRRIQVGLVTVLPIIKLASTQRLASQGHCVEQRLPPLRGAGAQSHVETVRELRVLPSLVRFEECISDSDRGWIVFLGSGILSYEGD